MITSSGVICDVDGQYILPLTEDEQVHHFIAAGIKKELHCCSQCMELLTSLKGVENGWKQLPDGPLRKAYEEVYKKED
jgi:hypothetical protein